jgi:hypothetical protein
MDQNSERERGRERERDRKRAVGGLAVVGQRRADRRVDVAGEAAGGESMPLERRRRRVDAAVRPLLHAAISETG